jgi:hypothetical protein
VVELLVGGGLVEGRNPKIEDGALHDSPLFKGEPKKLDFSMGEKGDFSGAFFVHPRLG